MIDAVKKITKKISSNEKDLRDLLKLIDSLNLLNNTSSKSYLTEQIKVKYKATILSVLNLDISRLTESEYKIYIKILQFDFLN